jgi:hypothetical protein
MLIPLSKTAPLIRTDFSSGGAWQRLLSTVSHPPDPFLFSMEIVDETANEGATVEELLAGIGDDRAYACFAVADSISISLPDHPLLVVDLMEERGRRFRAIASAIASIDNNLSIANMGFSEFANAVDESGVFRGFDAIP